MKELCNLSKNRVLASRPVLASSFFQRFRGMIGRDFSGFDAMIFLNCTAIHTFFMSIPLDVIFFDRENRIVKCVSNLRPWIPVCSASGGYGVVEMPVGAIASSCAEPGDFINLDIVLEKSLEKAKNRSILSGVGVLSGNALQK